MTTTPRIAIIGGSGLGNALLASGGGGTNPQSLDVDTPFGKPSAPIMLSEWNGIPIAFLPRHGLSHTIPPSAVNFRANIYALKAAGCQWILASPLRGSFPGEAIARHSGDSGSAHRQDEMDALERFLTSRAVC